MRTASCRARPEAALTVRPWDADLPGAFAATCSSPVDALSSRRPASAIVSSLICAKPPSTKSSAQLTKLLSSEARNTTAFATTYGSVRSILDNKIDRQTAQQPPTNGVPILHPNIRGPRYYH
jgi:hypothetical protein